MTSTQSTLKRTRLLAATATGLALIAILSGFAMSVMPLLSITGKAAAVIATGGFAITLIASVIHAWRPPTDEAIDGSEDYELQSAA
jgi:hypothetical protein